MLLRLFALLCIASSVLGASRRNRFGLDFGNDWPFGPRNNPFTGFSQRLRKQMMGQMGRMNRMGRMGGGGSWMSMNFGDDDFGFDDDFDMSSEDDDEDWDLSGENANSRTSFSSTTFTERKRNGENVGGGQQSVTNRCRNGRCELCLGGRGAAQRCFKGRYTSVVYNSGCEPAVCLRGCRGMQKSPGDGCPVCLCGDKVVREPCKNESDCSSGGECQRGACRYDPDELPAGDSTSVEEESGDSVAEDESGEIVDKMIN